MIPAALTANSVGRTNERRLAKTSISLASICKPAGMTVAITLELQEYFVAQINYVLMLASTHLQLVLC